MNRGNTVQAIISTHRETGNKRLDVSGECGESEGTQFVELLEKERIQFKQSVGCISKKKDEQELIAERKKIKLNGCLDKPLNGQQLSQTDEKGVSCWRWLQTVYFKKETESLVMAKQDQKLAIKAYRVTILKQQGFKKSRVCNKTDETVIISLVNVQSQYRLRTRKAIIKLPLRFSGNCRTCQHWYKHRADRVMENQDTKILKDFNIRLKARHPDILLINKNNKKNKARRFPWQE